MTNTKCGDGSDEAEDNRKTITVSDQDIQAAAHLLSVLVGGRDDRGRELTALAKGNGRRIDSQERAILVERAHQAYVNRARRSRIFSSAMFGEAAWDMLLALYVTDQSGPRHTVTGLVNLAGVPSTTALRWLDFLETKEQLVTRKPTWTDGRVLLIELTDKARDLLDEYFSGTALEGI